MSDVYLAALDQRTGFSRCVIYDQALRPVASAQKPVTILCPQPGWREYAPQELLASLQSALYEALYQSSLRPAQIGAVGLANQRETAVVWEKATGRPIYNAISWQCRRTEELCRRLAGDEDFARLTAQRTGLPLRPDFSATKLKWILDNVPGARRRAEAGELLFGTVDSWLIWNYSGRQLHLTDPTNASRTMLFDLHRLRWDEEICRYLDIPLCMLPQVAAPGQTFGQAALSGASLPLAAVAGNQQAVLLGQGCLAEGAAACSFDQDCFLMMNTGSRFCPGREDLYATLALGRGGQVCYALEGRTSWCGRVLDWMRQLRLLDDAADAEYFAAKQPDSGGVYWIPPRPGGGPGSFWGLGPDTGRDHLIRAGLESIAYQTADLLERMTALSGVRPPRLMADEIHSANRLLMGFTADLTGLPVCARPTAQVTTLGAAALAGMNAGLFGEEVLAAPHPDETLYQPRAGAAGRLEGWRAARARVWGRE